MGGASCRAFACARSVCPAREFAGERDRPLFRRCLWTECVPLAEAYRDHGEAERRAHPSRGNGSQPGERGRRAEAP